MTVILRKFSLFYASVPKVACTSIKHLFFEAENGFPFRPFTANGRPRHIHNAAYRGLPRDEFPEQVIERFHRVAVVRDPIRRFLSAYSNRVVVHRELAAENKLRDLAPTPELDAFIHNLDKYRAVSPSVMHHTRPMVDFLGTDPGYFSRLYRMEELDQFTSDMNARMGTNLTLRHLQTGGPKFYESDLTAAQMAKLKEFYAADYAAFGAFL